MCLLSQGGGALSSWFSLNLDSLGSFGSLLFQFLLSFSPSLHSFSFFLSLTFSLSQPSSSLTNFFSLSPFLDSLPLNSCNWLFDLNFGALIFFAEQECLFPFSRRRTAGRRLGFSLVFNVFWSSGAEKRGRGDEFVPLLVVFWCA